MNLPRNRLPKLPRPLSPQIPQRKTEAYQPYFQKLTILKEQFDNLESLIIRLCENAKPPTKNAFETMLNIFYSIQNATLGDLDEVVTNGINTLYSCFIGIEIPQEMEKCYSDFISICVSIQHLLTFSIPAMNFDLKVRHSPSLNSKLTESNNEDSRRTIICRICEHPIDVDLIEQHMKTCMDASYSESNIEKCNNKLLSIREQLSKNFLRIQWPGSNEKVYSIFHTTLIIDSIRRIGTNDSDSPEEIRELLKHLQSLEVPEIQNYLDAAITASREKKKSVFAYSTAKDELRQTYISNAPSIKSSPTSSVTIADFEFIKRVSRGAFARVFLARKTSTGDIYAIKVQSKQDVLSKNQGKRILAEKDILLHFQNPYIVNFYYSIVGEYNFYIVMEYIPGGDLYSLLHVMSAIDEESAKFYTYQITKALQFLHHSGIIHRDLKPDNLLVDAEGNLKLTDFGLSYHGVVDRRMSSADESIVQSDSLVGTPNYVAPEIIMSQKHSYPVDYWSLGAVVYELLMGEPPFAADTEKETHMRIMRGVYEHLDDEFSPECRDFVERLLTVNPEKRLGAHGAEEVLNHPWLRGYVPKEKPFVPELRSQTDTDYFKERYSFDNQSDVSIIKDIEAAKMNKTVPKGYMREFDSVGTKQLAQATLNAAKTLRRQSFSEIERKGLLQNPVKRPLSMDDSSFQGRMSATIKPLPPLIKK